MLTTEPSDAAVEYARPILLSLYPVLDRVEARLPQPPDSCVWQGLARTQYAMQLNQVREAIVLARAHLDRAVEALRIVGTCG